MTEHSVQSTSTSNHLERINVGVYLLDNFVNVLILSFYFMMFVFDKLKQLQQRPFPCCTLNVIDAHKECFLLLPSSYYSEAQIRASSDRIAEQGEQVASKKGNTIFTFQLNTKIFRDEIRIHFIVFLIFNCIVKSNNSTNRIY